MIFVTGATGLVGSHLIISLLQKGYQVRALKRKTADLWRVKKVFEWYSASAEDLFAMVEWVEGDILDYFSIEDALDGVNIIYHCAAYVSFDRRKRKRIMEVNVEGTTNLVNAALKKGVKRFCHLSSIAALGSKKDGMMITEDSFWAPGGKQSIYAESKFRSEAEVWRGVEEGLEAVVFHPSVIIGPGNWKNGSGLFFDRVYQGISFYTPGITGYVDVRDVTDAMILLTESQNFAMACNRKFLINAENLEFQQFLSMIAASLHKPAPKYRAGYYMLKAAGAILQLFALISGREAILNKDIISSALRKNYYDGSRICHQFGFRYRPVSEAIKHTSQCFLESLSSYQA